METSFSKFYKKPDLSKCLNDPTDQVSRRKSYLKIPKLYAGSRKQKSFWAQFTPPNFISKANGIFCLIQLASSSYQFSFTILILTIKNKIFRVLCSKFYDSQCPSFKEFFPCLVVRHFDFCCRPKTASTWYGGLIDYRFLWSRHHYWRRKLALGTRLWSFFISFYLILIKRLLHTRASSKSK